MIEFLLIGFIDLLFKTDLIKKEFEKFQNKVFINVLECGLCQRNSCEWDKNLLLLVIDAEKLGVKLVIALILQKKICLKS